MSFLVLMLSRKQIGHTYYAISQLARLFALNF
jgi:hypothetical protein